ncbi:MAG TPA: YfiR family protein, partial [Chitinophagaceae bacterium]|nr:YfiR family protein [Chitinophagaceae bacterium]
FLKGRNILTVSEAPDFSKEGGMIRFFTTENKIKLQINPDASREAGLVISSKLLRLAAIFNPKESN